MKKFLLFFLLLVFMLIFSCVISNIGFWDPLPCPEVKKSIPLILPTEAIINSPIFIHQRILTNMILIEEYLDNQATAHAYCKLLETLDLLDIYGLDINDYPALTELEKRIHFEFNRGNIH